MSNLTWAELTGNLNSVKNPCLLLNQKKLRLPDVLSLIFFKFSDIRVDPGTSYMAWYSNLSRSLSFVGCIHEVVFKVVT